MGKSCVRLCGFVLSCLGWLGIVIAATTNDWVITCKYAPHTCKMMEQLGVRGPWAECVVFTDLYQCSTYLQILDLPVYIQTTRALMVTASILGLLAVATLLMSMPCIRLGDEAQTSKDKRAVAGGLVMIVVGLCGLVPTVWFPLGVEPREDLLSFGFSLYAGWAGAVLSLLGGGVLSCSSSPGSPRPYQDANRFYYSKTGGNNAPAAAPAAKAPASNHAKSAHV
ncbi:claudin-11a [Syngnathoides biaculeatus]|uniref:claudin-11a n=1 Tax=Syngnathoides biaculeatus TaxID=300417 RepID=UPI002ADE90F7|nr:claudin-11a [Syngnathoides biaculeatus]